jgi:hypothetical protein
LTFFFLSFFLRSFFPPTKTWTWTSSENRVQTFERRKCVTRKRTQNSGLTLFSLRKKENSFLGFRQFDNALRAAESTFPTSRRRPTCPGCPTSRCRPTSRRCPTCPICPTSRCRPWAAPLEASFRDKKVHFGMLSSASRGRFRVTFVRNVVHERSRNTNEKKYFFSSASCADTWTAFSSQKVSLSG